MAEPLPRLRARVRWCVGSRRDLWCAAMVNRPFRVGADQIATACGHWIIFPGGSERREPNCLDCLALYSKATVDG